MSRWQVIAKTKLKKDISKLPKNIQEIYDALVLDLEEKGTFPGKKWQNYSKLRGNKHHCHLNRNYVACWKELDKKICIMEVYYVGSRENAPY